MEQLLQSDPVVDRHSVRGAFSRIGLGALLFLLSNGLVSAALMLLLQPYLPGTVLTVVTYAALYGVGTLSFYLAVRRVPRERRAKTAIPIGEWTKYLCIGYLFLIAGSIVGTVVTTVTGGEPIVEKYLLGTDVWANFLPLVVLAPVCEELMFRKFILDRAVPYGEREAVILSALLFALMHGNFSQAFYAFGLGLVLAVLYLRTRNLWYPIAIHAFVNLMQGVLPTLLQQSAGEGELAQQMALAPVSVLAFGLAAAGLVLLIINRGKDALSRSAIPRIGGLIYGNVGTILFFAVAAAMFVFMTLAA